MKYYLICVPLLLGIKFSPAQSTSSDSLSLWYNVFEVKEKIKNDELLDLEDLRKEILKSLSSSELEYLLEQLLDKAHTDIIKEILYERKNINSSSKKATYINDEIDTLLRNQLVTMFIEDQASWNENGQIVLDNEFKQELAKKNLLWLSTSARNLPYNILVDEHSLVVDSILSTNQNISSSTIGKYGMASIGFIILHSDLKFIKKYAPFIKNNFKSSFYAYLIDKSCVHNKLPQIYGSQVETVKGERQFYEIENVQNVDLRRMRVGLDPLEFYARSIGVNWNLEKMRLFGSSRTLEK